MLLFPPRIKKHVAAVAALESEVGNPNAAVFGCMIEFRSVHHVSERTNKRTNERSASQRVVGLGGVMSPRVVFSSPRQLIKSTWKRLFVGTQLSLKSMQPHFKSEEDCDAFGDRSTQRGATSKILGVVAPGSSLMPSHSEELVQTPDTISIKVEEDIGGGLPAVAFVVLISREIVRQDVEVA
ncbi:unnamed protein product [Boreogadus saida]